eukprot:gene10070-10945_t
MIFKPIRWIVFDITGTLLKFHPSVAEIYYQAAKNVQIEPPFLDPALMKPAFSKAYKQVNQEYPYTTLPTLNLHHHFQFALSSTDYGWMKPDSRQYLKAYEQMQFYDPHLASPEEVLYIGNDVEADYKGARASGFQSILI